MLLDPTVVRIALAAAAFSVLRLPAFAQAATALAGVHVLHLLGQRLVPACRSVGSPR